MGEGGSSGTEGGWRYHSGSKFCLPLFPIMHERIGGLYWTHNVTDIAIIPIVGKPRQTITYPTQWAQSLYPNTDLPDPLAILDFKLIRSLLTGRSEREWYLHLPSLNKAQWRVAVAMAVMVKTFCVVAPKNWHSPPKSIRSMQGKEKRKGLLIHLQNMNSRDSPSRFKREVTCRAKQRRGTRKESQQGNPLQMEQERNRTGEILCKKGSQGTCFGKSLTNKTNYGTVLEKFSYPLEVLLCY